jgi:hypothetical protein
MPLRCLTKGPPDEEEPRGAGRPAVAAGLNLRPPATSEEEDVSKDDRRLHAELRWLQSRYDDGKVSPAVFAVMKRLETELSWRQHAQEESRRA